MGRISRPDSLPRSRSQSIFSNCTPFSPTSLKGGKVTDKLLRATGRIDTGFGQRRPLRLLLAEDNIINQKVATRILSQMGYRPDVVHNGVEVLEALERQKYDVILMDVQMPEMDGLEATRQVRKRFTGARRPWIIAMTANAMDTDRKNCFDAGMDGYLSKSRCGSRRSRRSWCARRRISGRWSISRCCRVLAR